MEDINLELKVVEARGFESRTLVGHLKFMQ
jgi:hypothetical protein